MLRSIDAPLLDGENVQVNLDFAYTVRSNELLSTMDEIRRSHGDSICLLPLSATSAGGGVFQTEKPAGQCIVGLQFSATARPRISNGSNVRASDVALDEIIIDTDKGRVYAGSAITLEQLNLALAAQLGPQFKVLGADLTSYTYAQVGATFMTGGMGPQRRYFSDSVCAVALYDGESIKTLDHNQLAGYAGTFGWTGIVTAVCCEYHELPVNEIAFCIPVHNTLQNLPGLLDHLAPLCFFDSNSKKVLTDNMIHGLEQVTVASMQPYLQSGDNPLIKRARTLSHQCESAGADGLIFVNAF
ncbi:MAG: FAD-dependent oxidoreductase, partial [Gammaproteobacteria bacterium]|nr:FAD-dependent oxidoreductase [Gammaproteobacteria bacterium]